MHKLVPAIAIAAVLSVALSTSSAAVIWRPYLPPNDSMQEATANGLTQQAVFEARSNGQFPNDQWELALWDQRDNPDGPKSTADFSWVNGDKTHFTIQYIRETSTVVATFGTETLIYNHVSTFTDVVLRVRTTGPSFVDLSDLLFLSKDGTASHADLITYTPDSRGYQVIRNPNDAGVNQLLNSFTLTGDAQFQWTRKQPPGAQLAFQIYLATLDTQTISAPTSPAPAPSAAGLLGVAAMFAARRKR